MYSLARRLPPAKQILHAEQKNLGKLLRQFPPAPGLHLDLGSGTGDSMRTLPSASKRIAVDAEFSMLARNPAACRVSARAEELPFPTETFTFISAVGVLEYIDRSQVFFSEVKRVLQPAGSFLFTSSPPKLANRLRWLLGERLHFHTAPQIEMMLQISGWRILGHARSWLQEQWLVCHDPRHCNK
ncbi:MAG: class I SAM-dependent methyltransferase [candidate division KSB1 bacterium]|nr:class I SAM-dependent methyltransferase [candidate division KSB1 bacterium]